MARLQPPLRRVLAIDPGTRSLKLLLAENSLGGTHIVRQELIDLQKEGLVSAEETSAHLQSVVEAWGEPPMALVLPEHVSVSQLVDVPPEAESDVAKFIQSQTLKGGSTGEDRMLYSFFRASGPQSARQQFWVTFCREREIRERILRLGIEPESLCDVSTTANALITAFRAVTPETQRAILVHFGAEGTVVVILNEGHGAFAGSFQMGGDFFTRSLARIRNCTDESAEELKITTNVFEGPEASPEFASVVDGWVTELKGQLNDWFERHPALLEEVSTFRLFASGAGFEQPGLAGYLEKESGLGLTPWPRPARSESCTPPKNYEIVFGAALQALDDREQAVTLLPEDYLVAWHHRQLRQRIEVASVVLLAVLVLLLLIGSWNKVSLIRSKEALLAKAAAGQDAVEANEMLSSELLSEYESLRPLLAAEQNTADTLKTLALLQQSRSNRSFWYVLVADQQSYFSQPPALLTSTNRPARTNLLAAPGDRPLELGPIPAPRFPGAATNTLTGKPGLIAELCVPEGPETAREVISEVVYALKQQQLFSKADLLSEDLRRSMADPKVIVPDRHYALALDFAETDLQQSVVPKRSATATGRPGSRRSSRTQPAPSGADKVMLPP